MDAERRKQLEERREFAKARWRTKQWRASLQPALDALEASGEPFRIYSLGQQPRWNPAWIPAGYTYIPWLDLPGVEFRRDINEREELAEVMRELLAQRLAPDADVLFVASGKGWSIALPRRMFDAHAVPLLDTAWDSAYLVDPPNQWLIFGDWNQVMWKDG